VNALWAANVLAVLSTVSYAAGALTQQRIASVGGPTARRTSVALLVRRPRWWLAVLLNCLGGGLHVLALRLGPLTLVQPLGALTLVFALLVSTFRPGHPVSRREWRGAAMTMWGLAGLLLLTASVGPNRTLGGAATATVGAGTAACVLGLVVAGHWRRPLTRSLTLAAASGIVSGAASALTQTVALRVGGTGLAAQLGPAALLVGVFAVAGLFLSQAAYRGGLGAPLAVLTIANPLASAGIGITLLGERYVAGVPGAVAAAVSAVLVGYGVSLLAGSAHRDRPGTGTPTRVLEPAN
jgi:hypothetical protein